MTIANARYMIAARVSSSVARNVSVIDDCTAWNKSGTATNDTSAVFFMLWISRVVMAGNPARTPSGNKIDQNTARRPAPRERAASTCSRGKRAHSRSEQLSQMCARVQDQPHAGRQPVVRHAEPGQRPQSVDHEVVEEDGSTHVGGEDARKREGPEDDLDQGRNIAEHLYEGSGRVAKHPVVGEAQGADRHSDHERRQRCDQGQEHRDHEALGQQLAGLGRQPIGHGPVDGGACRSPLTVGKNTFRFCQRLSRTSSSGMSCRATSLSASNGMAASRSSAADAHASSQARSMPSTSSTIRNRVMS